MSIKWFAILFFVMLGMGLPIYAVLGASAGVMFFLSGQPLVGIAQKMLDELNSTLLLAIPFFVMAASFMQRGGVAKALIDVAAAWTGSMRGGLGIVTVLACAMFAAICGSSVATALAMGTILVPAMQKRGYDQPFSLGVVAASGTLGILIPPSLPLILYGIIADESVPRLFLAGVIPGLLQALLFMGLVLWFARTKNLPREPRMSREDFIKVNLNALPALTLPAIVAIGIYGGFVTATEAAVLAAVTALGVSLFFYKGFHWRETLSVIGESIHNAGTIMIIIATALAFGHWLTESGIPAAVVKFIVDNEFKPWQFLLFINVMLVILGMFLEVASIMLITLPILIPILKPLGIDPVHFAIIITINMELAVLTAPVGLNLFVIAGISKTPLSVVTKGVFPFEVALFLFLMMITYVPFVSTWLPNLVYGVR
jgi:C4-dicarboxylate transporter DctM subunit